MGNNFKNFGHLILNYLYDYFVFLRYSGVFNNDNEYKLLGKINYYYHSIEKGLINNPIRFKFGRSKIKKLLYYINIWVKKNYDINNSQFIASCAVLLRYFELHEGHDQKIDDILSYNDISMLRKYASNEVGGVLNLNSENYFNKRLGSFDIFSNSRHSVRHFNGEIVDIAKIEKAISIARNAPSVCNRQSVEVFLINNKEMAQKILEIQAGMNTTSENVQQIIIVTSEIGAFLSPVERNQMFVDGGIFLQNLLYALHFNGIAACALNWSKPFFYEFKVRKYLKISHQKRIISAIAIGYPTTNFKVPFSSRKNVDEILHIINS